MKNILLLRFILVGLFIILLGGMQAQDLDLPFSKDVIRIKFTPNAAARMEARAEVISDPMRTGIEGFDEVSTRYNAQRMRKVFRYGGKYENRHRQFGLNLWYEIETDGSGSAKDMIKDFGRLPEVSIAEEKVGYQLFGKADIPERGMEDKPNDPLYFNQWSYENHGQSGGTPGADINLRKAWELETGNPQVVVAIIDGGIDVNHEDLAANMWVNEDEIPDNSIDDDNNGYIDDYYGYNFVYNVPTIVPHPHGTHVAGTVAAVNNNGLGLNGIAGGSGNGDGVRLMSCQVFSTSLDGGPEYNGGFDEAFIYAADNGAVISNNSWGGGADSEIINDAIRYYVANAGLDPKSGAPTGPVAGGLAIFAAGNFNSYDQAIGVPTIMYPSVLEEAICVANTDHNDKKYAGSMFNEFVDISAPGTAIYSTLPNNDYGGPYWTGTSMASPHVAGVAALVASKYAFNITADEIRARLINTAKNIDNKNTAYAGYLGSGRVDAYAALVEDAVDVPTVKDWGFWNDGIDENSFDIGWNPVKNKFGVTITDYEIMVAEGEITNKEDFIAAAQIYPYKYTGQFSYGTYLISPLLSNTTYTVGLRAKDRDGNISNVSELIPATTWAAPTLEFVDAAPIEVAIDVSSDPQGHASFSFKNIGEGLSRFNWLPSNYRKLPEAELRTEDKGTYRSPSWDEPISIFSFTDTVQHENLMVPDVMIGPKSISFTYDYAYEGWMYANKFVAERDITLSQVGAYITNESQLDPQFSFAIYVGGEDYPAGEPKGSTGKYIRGMRDGGWYNTTLSSDVSIKAGEIYWVAVTAPDGVYYPIGAQKVTGSVYAARDKSYAQVSPSTNYVTDIGYNFKYLLMIRAYETIKTTELVSLTPKQGEISPGTQVDVDLTIDGSKLTNGKHYFELVTAHDDPSQGLMKQPVNVTVTGFEDVLTASVEKVDFGAFPLGFNPSFSGKISFELKNEGRSTIAGFSLSGLDDTYFTVSPTTIPTLEPGHVATVTISPKKSDVVALATSSLDVGGHFTLPVLAEYLGLEVSSSVLTTSGSSKYLYFGSSSSALPVGAQYTDYEAAPIQFTISNPTNYTATYSLRLQTPEETYIVITSPLEGELLAGESTDVTFTLDLTNELAKTSTSFGYLSKFIYVDYSVGNKALDDIALNVRPYVSGIPDLDVATLTVDFGSLEVGKSSTLEVDIMNLGTDYGFIRIDKPGAPFSNTTPFTNTSGTSFVAGNDSKTYPINFEPTAEGEFTDTFVVYFLDQRGGAAIDALETFTVNLTGIGTPAPPPPPSPEATFNWVGDITSETLDYGPNTGKSATLTLGNNSTEAELSYMISKPKWISVNGEVSGSAHGTDNDFGYTYNFVEYDWIDISEIGTSYTDEIPYPRTYTNLALEHFNFPYYGNEFSELSLGKGGFISFDPNIGSGFSNFNFELPDSRSGSSYSNSIVAPFWLGGPSITADVLVFQSTEYVVVQWNNVDTNAPRVQNYNFQMVLYPNGHIKFQYKAMEASGYIDSHTMGFESNDGIYGVTINVEEYPSGNRREDPALWNEKAIEITPPTFGKIGFGESAAINFQYNGTGKNLGDYIGKIRVLTNDVANPSNETDVSLTVTGTSDLSMSSTVIDFENIAYINDNSSFDTQDLSIVNNGVKPAIITSVSIIGDDASYFDVSLNNGTEIPGFQSIDFIATYTATDAEAHNAELVIETDAGVNFNVVLSADAVLPPSIVFEAGSGALNWVVNENEVGNYSISMTNAGTETGLDYDVTIGLANQGWGMSAKAVHTPTVFADSIGYDRPGDNADGWYGGPDLLTHIATKYKVKQEEGFYLTHLRTLIYRGESTDPYTIQVLQGEDIATAEVLLTQEYLGGSTNTENIAIPLDEQFFFEKGNTFYIKVIYPASVEFKFAYNYGVPSADGKYLISYDDGISWEQGPFTYAWKMRALSSLPNQWLTIDPSYGTIPTNGTQQVGITVDAQQLPEGTNKAFMYVSHNDPNQPGYRVPVNIRVNTAPVIDVETPITMNEGEVLTVEYSVIDSDNDNILSVEALETNDMLVSEYSAGMLSITLSPDFGMAGTHIYTFIAVDEYGAQKSYDIEVNVNNVNRAPEVTNAIDDLIIELGEDHLVAYNSVFEDPDNENMTFTTIAETNSVVELYESSQSLLLTSLTTGSTLVTVTATDEYGASTSNSFTIEVNKAPIVADFTSQSVKEGQILQFQIAITDEEGDDVTVNASNSNASLITSYSNGLLDVTFSPDFTMAGNYAFTLKATDEHGANQSFDLNIEVLNTNRAPEVANAIADRELYLGEQMEIVFADVFTDLDNEELEYELTSTNTMVLEVLTSQSASTFKAIDAGEVNFTLTATDNDGATAKVDFKVSVSYILGTNDFEIGSLEVYPNPVQSVMNINWNKQIEGNVIVRLINEIGVTVFTDELSALNANSYSIDMSQINNGMYHLLLITEEKTITRKIIKK